MMAGKGYIRLWFSARKGYSAEFVTAADDLFWPLLFLWYICVAVLIGVFGGFGFVAFVNEVRLALPMVGGAVRVWRTAHHGQMQFSSLASVFVWRPYVHCLER